MKQLLIASTSTLHSGLYLEYLLDAIKIHFKNTFEIIFIPYARPSGISYDDYTNIARKAFDKINIKVKGLHEYNKPIEALREAKGIFTGGGNTFVLVNTLYQLKLMTPLKNVINNGTPYLGTSAGSNICGLTMCTTNDMPIVYPPSFKTLGIVPFNINPHYQDPDPTSQHMGETRATRIKEFHQFNTQPVIGLREGSWLKVEGQSIELKGPLSARVFEHETEAYEIDSNSFLNKIKQQ